MDRQKKVITLLFLITLCFSVSFLTDSVFAEDTSEEKVYEMTDTITGVLRDGILTVSGTGIMPSFYNGDTPEWTKDAKDIKAIVIEEGITSIGVWSFYGLYNAVSVSIPDSVTTIQGRAFTSCTGLKKVVLPPELKILDDCFMYCSGLEELIINEKCERLEGNFLYGCTSLKKLRIPASVSYISYYAFQNNNIETLEIDENNPSFTMKDGYMFSKDEKTLLLCPSENVEETFIANGIEEIGPHAFDNKKGLKHVDLTGVKKIGDGAFRASGLLEVVIPDSVTFVDDFAFCGCPIKTLSIGSGLTSLQYCSFNACNELTEVYIPETVESAESYAFFECRKLQTVTIDGLQAISYRMFHGCDSLSNVYLGEGINRISREAFRECPSLLRIELPESITYVHDEAFDETTEVIPKNTELVSYGRINGYTLIDDFAVTGERRYDLAFEVLEKVNQERAADGKERLLMDPELTEAAMQRAAECSVLFAHTRPDGSSCLRVSNLIAGENIAAGSSTSEGAMTQWMNSSGHRANILKGSYTTLGVGVFVHDGAYYWVQLFGTNERYEDCSVSENCESTQEIHLSVAPFTEAVTGTGTVWSTGSTEYSYSYSIRYKNKEMSLGETQNLDLIVKAKNGWGSSRLDSDSVKWKSSDPSVADINNNGVLTAVSSGTCRISASSSYREKAVIDISVTGSISDAEISIEDTTYTGQAQEPEVTILLNGRSLVKDTDYTVSFKNNTNAGTASAEITGKGFLKGKREESFVILPAKISDTEVSNEEYTYTGKVIEATPHITLGETELVSGKDYKIEYIQNLNAGTARMKISGMGNFTGSRNDTFVILPFSFSETEITIHDQIYTGEELYPVPNIALEEYEMDPEVDYEAIWENNKEPGTAVCVIKGKGNFSGEKRIEFQICLPGEAVEENRIDSTCSSEGGYDEVIYCTDCGKELSREHKTLQILQHVAEKIPGIKATCVKEGLTDGEICSLCGDILKAQEKIPPLGHTPCILEGEPATCTEDGKTEGEECSVCHLVLKPQEVIKALGHEEEILEGKPATCTEPGLTEGSRCSVCKTEIVAQKEIPANGHDWEDGYTVDREPTCIEEGERSVHCKNCDAVKDREVIEILEHKEEILEGKPATCTEPGLTEGSRCSVCKTEIVAQKEIPANGHDWEDSYTVDKEPTCTEAGSRSIHCRHCSETKDTESIKATGHKPVEMRDTPDGYTKGEICSICRTVLKEPEEIISPLKAAITVLENSTQIVEIEKVQVANIPVDLALPKIDESKIKTTAMSGKRMKVNFTAVEGAKNYIIAQRGVKDSNWKYYTTGAKTEYILKNLKSKSLVQFKVAAYCNGRIGRWSNISYRYYVKTKAKFKGGKKQFTATIKKVKGATGYQIIYSLNKDMRGKKTVTSKSLKKVVKSLKKGRKYYIHYRPVKKYKGKTYVGIMRSAIVKTK